MMRLLRTLALAITVGLTSRAHLAKAQYLIAPPATFTSIIATPPSGPVQIAAAPVVLVGAVCLNNIGGPIWLDFFDSITAPVTVVSLPAWSSPQISNNAVGTAAVPAGGIVFHTGLWFDGSNVGWYYNSLAGDLGYCAITWRTLP